jgi:phenylacetate-CoA ligase
VPRRGDPAALEAIETASRDELHALQHQRLRRTLRHAFQHVPFYRQSLTAADRHPDDLRELADLGSFPLTTKDDLRRGYPFGMFAVPRQRIARLHASSGTTGQPTVVGYTRSDLDTWAALVARSLRAAGVRPGDRVHVGYGYGLFTGGLGAHYGAERLGATVIPVSGGATQRQAQLIRDFQPDAIMVTPSYMLAILDEMRRQGDDPRRSTLRVGVFGAEPWSERMRGEIESSLDMHAVDIYGLSEVMGPGVASECVETKDGPHLWEDHFLPEIIDPNTGQVLPDGAVGELVLTCLTRQAMPLLRYRTGDLTRLLPGTARTMRRMERVTGRVDDMIILRGVNLFPTQIEELVLRVQGLAPHFECVLRRPERLDEMTVRVESRTALASTATLGGRLRELVKERVGVSVDVEVLAPGTLTRSLGKARRVIDQRGHTLPAQ